MSRTKIRNRIIQGIALGVLITQSCDYKPRNQGRSLYEKHCQSCHMEEGQGLGSLIPPVANADYVVANREELACIIRNGIGGELEVNGIRYEGEMEGYSRLTEIEISNLVHYLLVDMNHQERAYEISEIRAQLEACQ